MAKHLVDTDRPDIRSPVVEAMMGDLEVVRDVAKGFSGVYSQSRNYTSVTLGKLGLSRQYLPKHPKETGENYAIRLARPTFFNAFLRTLDGLVGMVFRRNPVLGEDVPKAIREHWENIDNAGTHGDVFLKELFHDAMEAGHAGILVDYPKVANPESVTVAEEKEMGLRPYWVHVRKEDVFGFVTMQVASRTILEEVIVRQRTYERKGRFGQKPVTRFRVYTRRIVQQDGQEPQLSVDYEVWQVGDDGVPFPTEEKGVLGGMTEIPLVVVYGRRTGYMQSRPPLMDLAWLNILHYQTNSDYHHAAHLGNVPMFVTIGAGVEGEVTIGPNTSVNLPEKADAKWVETSGKALGHTRQMLQDIEAQEAVMGLSLLARDTRQAETAEAKRLDKSEKDSALTSAARSLEDGIELALQFHAQFLGVQDGGSVSVNRDFEQQQMSAAEIDAIGRLVQAGDLSPETLWQTLIEKGGVLPDDFDAEVERDRLAQGALAAIGETE